MKKRRLRNSPRQRFLLRMKQLLAQTVKMLEKTGKKMGLSPKMVEELKALPEILKGVFHGPAWSGAQKSAKLIVQRWGYETGASLQRVLKMLGACLEVELGCAEPAYRREYAKKLWKELRAAKIPPVKGRFLSKPACWSLADVVKDAKKRTVRS